MADRDIQRTWLSLRAKGNSPIARITIIIPIVGYFILFNTTVIDFLSMHTSICDNHECGVSWRILFLYFGSCAYGLASALYVAYCPTIVKDYDGAAPFFEAEKTYFSSAKNLHYLLSRMEDGGGRIAPSVATLFKKENFDPDKGFFRPLTPQELAEIMGDYYIMENHSRKKLRVLTFWLYRLGIVLLLVPTAGTFLEVLYLTGMRVARAIS